MSANPARREPVELPPAKPGQLPFLVRPAELDDVPAIARLKRAVWQLRLARYGGPVPAHFAPQQLIERYDPLVDAPTCLLLVAISRRPVKPPMIDAESAVVGFVLACPAAHLMPPHVWWLPALYTHPGLPGQGLGEKLLTAALAHIQGRQEGAVSWTFAANQRLCALYQKTGGRRLSDHLPPGIHPDLPAVAHQPHAGFAWDFAAQAA